MNIFLLGQILLYRFQAFHFPNSMNKVGWKIHHVEDSILAAATVPKLTLLHRQHYR